MGAAEPGGGQGNGLAFQGSFQELGAGLGVLEHGSSVLTGHGAWAKSMSPQLRCIPAGVSAETVPSGCEGPGMALHP